MPASSSHPRAIDRFCLPPGSPAASPSSISFSPSTTLNSPLGLDPTPLRKTSFAEGSYDGHSPASDNGALVHASPRQERHRKNEDKWKRTVTIVFWHTPNANPWIFRTQVETFPLLSLADVDPFLSTFEMTATDYIDAYNSAAQTWEIEQVSAVRTVQSEERRLYRVRRNMRTGLEDSECPTLDKELASQEEFKDQVAQLAMHRPNMPKNPKKRSLDSSGGQQSPKVRRPSSSVGFDSSFDPTSPKSSQSGDANDTPLFVELVDNVNAVFGSPCESTPVASSPGFLHASLLDNQDIPQAPSEAQYTPRTPINMNPSHHGSFLLQPPSISVSAPPPPPATSSELSRAFAVPESPVPAQQNHQLTNSPSRLNYPPLLQHSPLPAHSPLRSPLEPHPSTSQCPTPFTQPLEILPPPTAPDSPLSPPFAADSPDESLQKGSVGPSASSSTQPSRGKPWPYGKSLHEVDAGFAQMRQLMQREPGLKQPHAFSRVFGVEYKKSTVHNHHRAWREHQALVMDWRQRYPGPEHLPSWSDFMRAVAAVEKDRRDSGSQAKAAAAAGPDGYAQVRAFGSPQGGVMMAVQPPGLVRPTPLGVVQTMVPPPPVRLPQPGLAHMRRPDDPQNPYLGASVPRGGWFGR
ncbi:uncharacterized protein BXZ73DRAFT_45032 [Epithele typhae]|uniref:uncharacterized protein n=1 Tax=Epithele typhae TaxID=378194 RepID=UPI0020077528|nr:uncharacterized protein BXZ73DRAFT_45032 [Epithele typhae]KAH9936870.1 hypothetical protein BXZ73DRAFT_45032 [Epithele typhae]